ncbi:MAG: TetR/AcrR family transcriptional regulator [Thermodesulfobacteriota bacterium]
MTRNIVEKTKERYLDSERRHQEILEVAIRLFNDKGYTGATTAEIARNAGISEPILYKHFENKKALFQECYQSITRELFAAYRLVYKANPGDEIAYLKGVTDVYIDFVRNNPDKSMFLAHLLSYKNDPDFKDDFRKLMADSIRTVEKVIRSAQQKGLLKTKIKARFMAAFFVGNYFLALAIKDFVPDEEFNGDDFFELIRMSTDI